MCNVVQRQLENWVFRDEFNVACRKRDNLVQPKREFDN